MRVLAFASQKTGAGKTTLAGHMAVQAQQNGMTSVAVIDADPEASLADWCALRTDRPLAHARATQAELLQKIESLRAAGTELVVIDTPPALNQSIEAALQAAHLVAIPTRPCAHDLEAAGAIVEMVQQAGKPFVFIVNGVQAGAELPPEVVMALAQHGPVAIAAIPRNLAFVESMIDGRTVMEIGADPSPAPNVEKLWQYLSGRLPKADEAAAAPPQAAVSPGPSGAPAGALFGGKAAMPKDGSSPGATFHAAMGAADPDSQGSPEAMRKYPRFVYERPAKLVFANQEVECIVNDISAGGALIRVALPLSVGDIVNLKLESIDDLSAEVRHREEDRVGLRFKIEPKQQLSLVKSLSAMVAAGAGRRT
jgi:chromosome partitioning protein